MSDDEKTTKHPAFGKIRAAYVSGSENLFMVDYPQMHFVTLRISGATLRRENGSDWVFSDEAIIEVKMSEVQWARLISTPNTDGVPCTLDYYRDAKTGKMIQPKMPEKHVADHKTFAAEIDKTAKDAAAKVKTALDKVNALMKGGSVKKADLKEVQELLYFANMGIAENASFLVKQAEEAIEEAVENAKTEVDTHIDYSLARLGERALGDRLHAAIEQGVDLREVGKSIAAAVTDKSTKD